MLDRLKDRLLFWYVFIFLPCACYGCLDFFLDAPTSKFGDALRAQVEERLNFFETGAPPSKNADAMRKVLDDLAMDIDDDDADEDMADAEPILTTLEPTPRKEKKKKRKSEAMDVDDDEGHTAKKVKLSKEEKKALKRAKKEKKEAKAAASIDVSLFFVRLILFVFTHISVGRGYPEEEEGEERKEEEQGVISFLICSIFLSFVYTHLISVVHPSLCLSWRPV